MNDAPPHAILPADPLADLAAAARDAAVLAFKLACKADPRRCRWLELSDPKLGSFRHCAARIARRGLCAAHNRQRRVAAMHREKNNQQTDRRAAKRLGLQTLAARGLPASGRQWRKLRKQTQKLLRQDARRASAADGEETTRPCTDASPSP